MLILLILVVGIPSTTYNGVLPPVAVPKPLITTDGELPGASDEITCTPAALPWIAWEAFKTLVLETSSAFKEVIAVVLSIFLRLP